MHTDATVHGRRFTVEFVVLDNGTSPPREVLDSLNMVDRAAFHVAMRRLADEGWIHNEERFKKIEGTELFEFKKHQHRFVGFFLPGSRFIIATYERKKKDRLRPQTIKAADSIRRRLIIDRR